MSDDFVVVVTDRSPVLLPRLMIAPSTNFVTALVSGVTIGFRPPTAAVPQLLRDKNCSALSRMWALGSIDCLNDKPKAVTICLYSPLHQHTYGYPVLIAVLAAVSVVPLVVVARQFRRGHLIWDAGTAFILILGWAALIPVVLNKLSDDVMHSWNYWGELVEVPVPVDPRVQSALQYVIIGASLLLLWRSARNADTRRISLFGIAVIGTSFVAMAVDTSAYDSIIKGQPMVLLVVLAAASFATPSREGAITGGALFAISVCATGAFLGLYSPDKVFMPCRDKCSLAGELYMAATPHSNTLGLITAIGIPFVWLAFKGPARFWMLVYIGANLVITGSRTSMFAAAATLVVLALTNPTNTGEGLVGRRRALLTLGVVTSTAVAMILPFTGQPDAFATGRGYLWRIAVEQFEQTPFFGAGLTAWDRFYAAGEFGAAAAYSTHNQWLELMLLAGAVGAVIFALGWAILIFGGDDSRKFVVLPVLLTVALLSATERPLSIGLINTMTWVLVALVATSSEGRQDKGEQASASPRPNLSSRFTSTHNPSQFRTANPGITPTRAASRPTTRSEVAVAPVVYS
ncbi:O-antigen ligase family protein [Rhodococcus opacus]